MINDQFTGDMHELPAKMYWNTRAHVFYLFISKLATP